MSKEPSDVDFETKGEGLVPTVIAPVKGKGTRLFPLTLDQSKTLIPVANVAIFERMLENLASYGCKSFWLVGEYELYNYFRIGETLSGRLKMNPKLAFNYTIEDDRGNADGVRIALEKRHMKNDEYKITGDVIIASGDCVMDLNLERLIEAHRRNYADMTIVLKEAEDLGSYGVAKIEGDRIVDFIEKPSPNEAPGKLVNTFINIVAADKLREIFDEMKNKNLEATDFGSHIIPYMVKRHVVKSYINEGYWEDVGTPKNLLRANLAVLEGKIRGSNLEPRIHPTSIPSIGQNVDMDNVVIGANVNLGSNCRLHNVCIDSNVTIGDNVMVEDSVLYFGARIGKGCKIIKSIVDRFGDTGDDTQVGDYEPDETAVIGSYTRLGDDWHVWPGELVTRYSPEAREKILEAKRSGTGLYKIISDDGENLYFVDRMVLRKTYNDITPAIFGKGERPC